MGVGTADRASPLHRGDPTSLGPYRLAGRLGSGGMGVVYLARDPAARNVAIKLVHAELADNPQFRARFRSEVERARQVPSFCTAEVLDADLDHNPPYLVVEYVDGPSLAEEVEENGPLPASRLHAVAVGVATALAGIHGAGVIHRDLKPQNVLLATGTIKVIDFGLARAFEVDGKYTHSDEWVGTVAYMAPERFAEENEEPVSPAADVFAWGCVVGFAGGGRTPFHSDSPAATAARILTQPPRLDGLTEPLRSLVGQALEKNPEDRPTARELLDLLVAEPSPDPASSDAGGPGDALPVASPISAALAAGLVADVPGRAAAPAAGVRELAFRFVPRQYPAWGAPVGPLPATTPASPSPAPSPATSLATSPAPAPAPASPLSSDARSPGSSAVPEPGMSQVDRRLAVFAVLLVVAGISIALTDVPLRGRWTVAGPVGEQVTTARPVLPAVPPGAAPPASTASTAPAGVPPARPDDQPSTVVPVDPTASRPGDRLVFTDPLDDDGRWKDSENSAEGSECRVSGLLRVSRASVGESRCPGPTIVADDPVSVSVSVDLRSPASCGAVWIHASRGRGGDLVRICAEGAQLLTAGRAGLEVVGSLRPARPQPVRTRVPVRLDVAGGRLDVWRDGERLGTLRLPEDGPRRGEIQLGISVDTDFVPPPYEVTYSRLVIRES